MITAKRKKPEFRKRDGQWTHYFIGVLLILFGVMFFLSMFSENNNTFLDSICAFTVAPFMVVGMIILAVFTFREGSSVQKDKDNWFKTCATAQTTVVERQEIENDPNDIDYANSYGQYMPSKYWYLRLRPIPAQLRVQPKATMVSVSMGESQYKNYEDKASVTIYYSPKDPFVFLLEDEV